MENPLVAERYWEELTDRMTMLVINKDPILKDPAKAALIDRIKNDALAKAKEQTRLMRNGLSSSFQTVAQQTDGLALLLRNTLYLSSDFATYPGPSLHLYLTSMVDPRDSAFPDTSARDLGVMQSPYGAQAYDLGEDPKMSTYRTVVVYDTELGLIYGFTQLGK